jgi:DNA-3-methyladenine glycosylase
MERHLTSGPARLCQALGIGRDWNGVDLCDRSSPIVIAIHPDREAFVAGNGPVIASPRVGISQAKSLPLRFHLPGSRHVSRV